MKAVHIDLADQTGKHIQLEADLTYLPRAKEVIFYDGLQYEVTNVVHQPELNRVHITAMKYAWSTK